MKRRHKYNAQACQARDGTKFQTKKERDYYETLLLRQRAGEISHLVVQPEYPIVIDGAPVRALPDKRGRRGRPLVYKADFAFLDLTEGKAKVVDVKGKDLPMSRLKRALVKHIYRRDVEVV